MKNKNYFYYLLIAFATLLMFSRCAKKTADIETSESATTHLAKSFSTHLATVYTVQPGQWELDGAGISPGTIIDIPAGARGALLIKNLKGTQANPIIITNSGGQVTFSATTSAGYAFKTIGCQYFKVFGTGVSTINYGFVVNGGNMGMTMDSLSSDFEIAHVEVSNSGFAGIVAKTDPTCDVSTQRGHFTMANVSLHNNYVHNTGGEGFYIGNSFYAEGMSLSCGTVYPGQVRSAKIYDNITDSTGCEGIQVGSATSGCEIYGNVVKNTGLSPFAAFQNNGIQLGEGTGGKCYNNLIVNAPGDGIILLGLGDNQLYNNIIINSGSEGIFAGTRYTPGPGYQFINNTIVNTGDDGIKLDSENIPVNYVYNNLVVNPKSGSGIVAISNAVKITGSNNHVTSNLNSVGFVDFNGGNYHLLSSSPLTTGGINVSSFGVIFDYYYTPRPASGAIATGATQ